MARQMEWWRSGLSPWVKFVYVVLLLNGLPAFFILMSVPHLTESLFVWTVKPEVSARMLGAMYGNALLLVVLGGMQPNWAKARITMVVITLFSISATLITFLHLDPFLQHPWFHLAYWLTMYLVLFFMAPYVFWLEERAHGGRLKVEVPLTAAARAMAAFGLLTCGVTGLGLIISPQFVNQFWPWTLTPLVGRLLGVWFSTLAVAYGWALWDGDHQRSRPIFWQAVPTGILVALVPLLHGGDIRPGAEPQLVLYMALSLLAVMGGITAVLGQHRAKVAKASNG